MTGVKNNDDEAPVINGTQIYASIIDHTLKKLSFKIHPDAEIMSIELDRDKHNTMQNIMIITTI